MTTSRDKGEAHTKRSLMLGSVIRGQAEINEIFSFFSYSQQVCKLNKPPGSSESDEVGDSCNRAWVGTTVSFQETLPELNCVCFSLKPVVEPYALPSIFLARTLTHLAQNCKIAQLLKKLDLFVAFWRDGWGDRFLIIFEIINIITIIINITVIFRKKLPPPFWVNHSLVLFFHRQVV